MSAIDNFLFDTFKFIVRFSMLKNYLNIIKLQFISSPIFLFQLFLFSLSFSLYDITQFFWLNTVLITLLFLPFLFTCLFLHVPHLSVITDFQCFIGFFNNTSYNKAALSNHRVSSIFRTRTMYQTQTIKIASLILITNGDLKITYGWNE